MTGEIDTSFDDALKMTREAGVEAIMEFEVMPGVNYTRAEAENAWDQFNEIKDEDDEPLDLIVHKPNPNTKPGFTTSYREYRNKQISNVVGTFDQRRFATDDEYFEEISNKLADDYMKRWKARQKPVENPEKNSEEFTVVQPLYTSPEHTIFNNG